MPDLNFPTGTSGAPFTIDNKPVLDFRDPHDVKMLVLEPGQKYTLLDYGGLWAAVKTES